MTAYLNLLKLGGIAVLAALLVGAGFHFGGIGPTAALERFKAAQSELVAKAVLAERASAQAQALVNHIAESTHAIDLAKIDDTPSIGTPVIVYRNPPACVGPVPSAPAQTGGIAAHPEGGGSEPMDRGRDIRPVLEEVKKRLERVMADYRQEDAEWPNAGLAPK